MLINRQHRLLFIHVPKTGGVSLSNALVPWGDPTQPEFYPKRSSDPVVAVTYPRHITAATLRGLLGAEAFASFWSFAIVRHPLERLVSHFAYVRRLAAHPAHAALRSVTTFAGYVAELGRRAPTLPITHYTHDPETGRQLVSQVFDLSQLAHAFRAATERLQLREPPALPHLNTSPHRPWREYYTPELEATARAYFAADFEAFGHLWREPALFAGPAGATGPQAPDRKSAIENPKSRIPAWLRAFARDE